MSEEDIEKTAFQFRSGKGNEFLPGLEETHVQAFMDVKIVLSRNQGEHKEHLERILARLQEFGLKISREKWSL
jgi:hypothetical protein